MVIKYKMEFSESQKAFISDLFNKIDKNISKQNLEIKEVSSQVTELKTEIQKVHEGYENRIKELEQQNKKLLKTNIFLERKIRKNNLVIFGLTINENEDLEDKVTNFFQTKLNIEISDKDINDIYKLGPKNNSIAPILIEFISYKNKQAILKNAYKLKGESIYINSDLCPDDQKINKILFKHKKEAISKGIKAKVRGSKLIIGEEEYTVEDLESRDQCELEEASLEEASAPATPNHITSQKRLLEEQEDSNLKKTETKETKKIKLNNQNEVRKITRSTTQTKAK